METVEGGWANLQSISDRLQPFRLNFLQTSTLSSVRERSGRMLERPES